MKKMITLLASLASLSLSGCVGGGSSSSIGGAAGFTTVGTSFNNVSMQNFPIAYDKAKNQVWRFDLDRNNNTIYVKGLCFISAQAGSSSAWDCTTVKLPAGVSFDSRHLLVSWNADLFMIDSNNYVWTYNTVSGQFHQSSNPINFSGSSAMIDTWTVKEPEGVIYATTLLSSGSLYTLLNNTGELTLNTSPLFPAQISSLAGIAVASVGSGAYVYGAPGMGGANQASLVAQQLIGSGVSNTFGTLPANTGVMSIAADNKNLYICGMDSSSASTNPNSTAVFFIGLNQAATTPWTSLGAVTSFGSLPVSCQSIVTGNSNIYVTTPSAVMGETSKSQLYKRSV